MKRIVAILGFYVRLMPSFSVLGYLARRLTWGRMRADFHGQRWVVTGGSDGIGRAIVRAAAVAGADVIAVARASERLECVGHGLPADAAARITTRAADLSLIRETASLADSLASAPGSIDVLVNNAGILLAAPEPTDEGLEASFTVNLLSHYQLTEALIGADAIGKGGVVVNMSSGGMYNVPLNIKGLLRTDPDRYSGKIVYACHKRAQVALTDYWNARHAARGIQFHVMHPGWVRTAGVRRSMPLFAKLQAPVLRTPRQGGDTALWLCHARPQPRPDRIWFDRRPRGVHLVAATRNARSTPEALGQYLQSMLEPT